MAQTSIVKALIKDAEETATIMENAIKEAGVDGIIIEVNMRRKYNEYVIKVNRKTYYPRDDEPL